MNDTELLRRFARDRDERAFAELVRHHVDLVYAAALRHVGSDRHRAEDIAQLVFIDLARKAPDLTRHPCLAGWLYANTRFTALNTIRREQRRATREQEAVTMPDTASTPETQWEQIRPLIDDAMQELDERDRQSVLLRFFGQQTFSTIGAELGLSENAAQKRVDRALDRLSAALARRGITSTSAALAAALVHSGVAAPASLAPSLTTAALAGATAGIASTSIFTFMNLLKILAASAAAGAIGAVGFAGGSWYQTDIAARQAEQREADLTYQVKQLETRVRSEKKRAEAAEADTAKLLTAVEQARQSRVAAQSTPPPRVPPAPPPSPSYVIRPGDTLPAMAQKLGLTSETLQALNPAIDFRRLRVGQAIVVPPGTVIPTASSSDVTASPTTQALSEGSGYIIAAGDTAAKIAEQNGLTLDQISSLNPGVNWARLRVGQQIRVH